MKKVKIGFYCTKEKKSYNAGDEYKGKRTDINHLLEIKEKKIQGENKNGKPKAARTKKK